MKIMIVEDDSDIRDILMFTFDSEVSAEYLYSGSGNEAIELIKKTHDIDLIVCDYNMPDGNGGDVYTYLMENDYKIPYVMCSSDSVDDHEEFNDRSLMLHHIVKPNLFEGVYETLTAFDKMRESTPTGSGEVDRKNSTYTQINTELLLLAQTIPCSIYLKINDQKHLKIFKEGDVFTQADKEKYIDKEIQKLIIEKKDVELFVSIVTNKVTSIIKSTEIEDESKVLDIHSVIMDTISSLGLSKQIIRATEKSIEFTISILKENKDFKDVYKNLLDHHSKYLTKHSIALAYIANGILIKTSWDTPDNRNRLALASFFHDVAIKVSDFNEQSEQEIENITLKDFKEHPAEAARLLGQLSGVPSDLDRIILDHHERPDGSGMPRGLNSDQIQPLSALFVFAHDVVDGIFSLQDKNKKLNKENLAKELTPKLYSEGRYKKCYEGFELATLFDEDS